jgi:hypothetical protein
MPPYWTKACDPFPPPGVDVKKMHTRTDKEVHLLSILEQQHAHRWVFTRKNESDFELLAKTTQPHLLIEMESQHKSEERYQVGNT